MVDYAIHMDKWLTSDNGTVKTSTAQLHAMLMDLGADNGTVKTSTAQLYAMLMDLGDEIKKELVAKMIPALQRFQKQYPAITSADLQTFILGYQAAIDTLNFK